MTCPACAVPVDGTKVQVLAVDLCSIHAQVFESLARGHESRPTGLCVTKVLEAT